MWQNGHSSVAAMAEYSNLSRQRIVSELMDNTVTFRSVHLSVGAAPVQGRVGRGGGGRRFGTTFSVHQVEDLRGGRARMNARQGRLLHENRPPRKTSKSPFVEPHVKQPYEKVDSRIDLRERLFSRSILPLRRIVLWASSAFLEDTFFGTTNFLD